MEAKTIKASVEVVDNVVKNSSIMIINMMVWMKL